MAQIREYREQVQVPVGRGSTVPRATAPEGLGHLGAMNTEASNALARGAHTLMSGIRERDEEEARAWSAGVLSNARLQWTTGLIERQANAGPGAPNFTPGVISEFDEFTSKTLDSAPTPIARRYLGERLTSMRTELGEKAMTFEAQARIDWRTDQFTSAIQTTQKLMNTDPGQYPVAMAERLAEIDGSAIPPVKKSALRERAVTDISSAAVWSQIQKSPNAFLQSIGFLTADATGKTRRSTGDLSGSTGNLAFDALPFDKRSQLFQQAIALKAQSDTDGDKAARDERHRIGNDAATQGWKLIYDAKFKDARAWIERIAPVIDAPVYHSLRAALDQKLKGDGAGAKTDPGTFRELQRLISEHKTDEASAFAFRAHRNGLLSNEHLSSTVSRTESLARKGGPDTEYEITLRNITRALEPGAGVPDPVGRSRQADAIATFDRWVKENKPDDKQIRERGGEIRQQYQFLNLQDTILALPMPRSGQIRRMPADTSGMQQDILRAGEEAQRRRASKKINEREYNEEIEILDRWRRAIGAGRK